MYIRSASSPSTVLWAFHTTQPSSFTPVFIEQINDDDDDDVDDDDAVTIVI